MTEQQAFVNFLSRTFKEGGLIVAAGAALLLAVALAEYDHRDPGWSHLGYTGEVRNPTGLLGAWIADFLFSMLGWAAWLLPVLMLYAIARLFALKTSGWRRVLPYLFLRFAGVLLLFGACSVLLTFHFRNPLQFPFSAGGMIGLHLGQQGLLLLGEVGTTLAAVSTLLLGLTLVGEFSWLQLADALGEGVIRSGEVMGGLARRLFRAGASVATPAAATLEVSRPAKESVAEKPAGRSDSHVRVRTITEHQEPKLDNLDGIEPESEAAGRSEPVLAMTGSVSGDRAVAASAQPEGEEGSDELPAARALKIVPLSETHRSNLDGEFDDEQKEAHPARKKAIPSLSLLDPPDAIQSPGYSSEQLESMSRLLEEKLRDFGVVAEVVEVNPGPVITRFEIQPAPGTKVSKITNLAKDLARSMAVMSVRVVEVIAGKSVVGIEIPNENRQIVRLSEVLGSTAYEKASSRLSLALGNDIAGNPVVVNLAKMPHLLVAGTTGSGKSVGINAMLLSLLFKATPEEVRLMMVDPKMLELSIYDGIPHLLTPVITDMKEAATGLRWCVAEMERRYRLMAKMGVRNLAGFNEKIREAEARGESIPDPLWNPEAEGEPADAPAPALRPLPYIVVVIDEFADMMMIVGKKVEELIARIAQKARAAGIHLILATQRPSVDVITGLIKANVPTRIAFQVSSKIDSRTILDQGGAENLLGNGDMLYLPAGTSMPIRVHGAFVADDEVHRVVEAWKQWGPPEYVEEILQENVDVDYTSSGSAVSGGLFEDEQDALYDEAVAFVIQSRRASISAVQRKLKIGYNRAARMIEAMEAAGIVSEANHSGMREVLVPAPGE